METKRRLIGTGAPWEEIVGYSRGIRVGNQIEISGTCAVPTGDQPISNSAYHQTVQILDIIKASVEKLGGRMEDVVRTRIFVTDIRLWEEIGKAHGLYFHAIKPVTTMVEVSRLIKPEFLVEIEATAIVPQ